MLQDKTCAQLLDAKFATGFARWLEERAVRRELGNRNTYRDRESFEKAINEAIRRKPQLFTNMMAQAFTQKQIAEYYYNQIVRYV